MKTQDIVEAPAAVLARLRERRHGSRHGWHATGRRPTFARLLDLCLVARNDGTEGFGGIDLKVPAVGDLCADAFRKDLVGLSEFAVLARQGLDPLALVRARAVPQTRVPLGLPDSIPERLARAADLGPEPPILAAIELIAAHGEACSP